MYLKSRYTAEQLYAVTADHQARETMDLTVSSGTIVGIIKDKDPLGGGDRWFVDSGETKGFLPSNILVRMGTSQPSHQISSQAQYQYQATLVPPETYEQPQSHKSATGSYYTELIHFDDLNHGGSGSGSGGHDAPNAETNAPAVDGAAAGNAYYCNIEDIAGASDSAAEAAPRVSSETQNSTVYRVLYGFDGMGSNTLPISKGDLVEFLIGHDQEGNTEWWYVKNVKTESKGYVPANYLASTA